jgi:hypothetical protein
MKQQYENSLSSSDKVNWAVCVHNTYASISNRSPGALNVFHGRLYSAPCQITASASRLISYHYKIKILISPCLPRSWHNIQNPSTNDQYFFNNLRLGRKINAHTLNIASVTLKAVG